MVTDAVHDKEHPSMAFPAAVTTATVTAGSDLTFSGEPVSVTVEVTPVIGGTGNHIVWEATGQPFDTFLETFKASPGNPVSFQLPHVDQAGFVNGNGDAVTMWAYVAKITTRRGTDVKTRAKSFQVVTGQSVIDLDLVPDGSITPPVVAPTAVVTSVNGQIGEVVIPDPTTHIGDKVYNFYYGPASPLPAAGGATNNMTSLKSVVDSAIDGTTFEVLPDGDVLVTRDCVVQAQAYMYFNSKDTGGSAQAYITWEDSDPAPYPYYALDRGNYLIGSQVGSSVVVGGALPPVKVTAGTVLRVGINYASTQQAHTATTLELYVSALA